MRRCTSEPPQTGPNAMNFWPTNKVRGIFGERADLWQRRHWNWISSASSSSFGWLMISRLYLFGLPFAILLSAVNDVSAKVVTLPSTTSTESLCKTGRSLIFGYCKLSGHDQLWSTTHLRCNCNDNGNVNWSHSNGKRKCFVATWLDPHCVCLICCNGFCACKCVANFDVYGH